jgi:hypothetical protein
VRKTILDENLAFDNAMKALPVRLAGQPSIDLRHRRVQFYDEGCEQRAQRMNIALQVRPLRRVCPQKSS